MPALEKPLEAAQDPTATLNTFTLDDLAPFKRERSFPANDSPDFRCLYAGRDDVHGALKYALARCTRSLRLNMFGYDDDELDAVIRQLMVDDHVYVQGTLDKSQATGIHEKKILASWTDAMRASFAIGQSATHQISHTKGGVIDGRLAWEGSTNWSASGEGTIIAPDKSDTGRKAQNNTCLFFTDTVEISSFAAELDEEHAVALAQMGGVTPSGVKQAVARRPRR